MDGQTDRHDEPVRVQFFAIWVRNPKKAENLHQNKKIKPNVLKALWARTIILKLRI